MEITAIVHGYKNYLHDLKFGVYNHATQIFLEQKTATYSTKVQQVFYHIGHFLLAAEQANLEISTLGQWKYSQDPRRVHQYQKETALIISQMDEYYQFVLGLLPEIEDSELVDSLFQNIVNQY